ARLKPTQATSRAIRTARSQGSSLPSRSAGLPSGPCPDPGRGPASPLGPVDSTETDIAAPPGGGLLGRPDARSLPIANRSILAPETVLGRRTGGVAGLGARTDSSGIGAGVAMGPGRAGAWALTSGAGRGTMSPGQPP